MIESVFAALPIGRENAISRIALAALVQISEWKLREILAVLVSERRADVARELTPRSNVGFRYVYCRDEWLSIETMPIGRAVLVRTATGGDRLARRRDYSQIRLRGLRGPAVSCYVEPTGHVSVSAVGWREPNLN